MSRKTDKALEIAAASGYEKEHAEQVRKLALKIFDELAELHRLGDSARELLEISAILHDIGAEAGKTHHKAARDIIISSQELFFEDDAERRTVALIVRYHKGGLPEAEHKYYSDLDAVSRDKVDKLAAILRVADGLDRTHSAAVADLKCEILEERVVLRLDAEKISGIDEAAAEEKSDLFKKTFGKEIEIKRT